jgi:hypothetical protein
VKLIKIMDELGAACDTISGLRVTAYPEARVNPPQAMVSYPRRYSYDETYGNGCEDVELSVVVFVGGRDAGSVRNALGQYVDGIGGTSIKEAIEKHVTNVWDIAHVIDAEFIIATVAGVEYQSAMFRVRVLGKGTV